MTRRHRIAFALLGVLALAWTSGAPLAQVANRNVNMVSGGTFPGGDPFLQKQNEPSIAISTRNHCHLLAGANDYRAVQLPGLPDDQEVGDAWLGWYESVDCGRTWFSTLVPGYAQDTSAAGLASPVKGLSAGADPAVRSGAAGSFYYLFIAFNRGANVGKLALARAIDHNDRESFIDASTMPDEAARRVKSPMQYAGTLEVARGSAGQFVDKPSLAVFPAASGTCTLDGETVPATNVYMAWTEFIGNGGEGRSKIYLARSANCGASLAGPATKLSEGLQLVQGTSIAVNPNNPNQIWVVWRQFRNSKGRDAIMFARSSDGGRSFTKPMPIPGLAEGQFAPFDQRTTSAARGSVTTTFRTTAYPSLAFADDGYLYLAVSQVPGGPTGTLGGSQARVVMTRTADGNAWAPLTDVVATNAAGQQFMPALAYAAGKLQMIWYDLRFDEANQTDAALVDEVAALATGKRRTLDLLGAEASITAEAPWPPAFRLYGVSQPDYDQIENGVGVPRGPRVSQYPIGDRDPSTEQGTGPRQLQFNRGNLLLYGGGTVPFMGDYVDISGIPFVFDGTRWVPNGMANRDNPALTLFQATWTDNRDVRQGKATPTTDGTVPYAKPLFLPAGSTIADAQCPAGFDDTATRDANVYSSRITQEFTLSVPSNAKATNTPGVTRAFAVQIANNLPLASGKAPSKYRLTVTDPRASFSRTSFTVNRQTGACTIGARVSFIDVNVLPKSSAARTVYTSCATTAAAAQIEVRAEKTAGPAPLGGTASVVINPAPGSAPTRGPDGQPLGAETHTPDAENPDAENPDAENPDAENPDAENPDAENPDAENPDVENPDAENPDAENPDVENPDAENPDVENAAYQDLSTDIVNDGNTTSAYQVQVQASGNTSAYQTLLLGRTVYTTPTSIRCHLIGKRTNQQVFAIPLADSDLHQASFLDENAEGASHATFVLRPGESIKVTARFVYNRETTAPFCTTDCFDKLVIRTQAQAPEPDGTLADDSVGTTPIPDLTVSGDLTSPGLVAGFGSIIDLHAAVVSNGGGLDAGPFDWRYGFGAGSAVPPVVFDPNTAGTIAGLMSDSTATIPARRLRTPIPVPYEGGPGIPGNYTLGLFIDPANTVAESNELNNVLASPLPLLVVPHTILVTPNVIGTQDEFNPIAFTVKVVDGPDTALAIENAFVEVTVEGPGTVDGIPAAGVNAGNATTNAAGDAFFSIPALGTGNSYRFVITVTITGVGTMRFQTNRFDVVAG